MEFRLLGPLEVADAGRSVAVGGGKRRSLLAVLLIHPNQVVSAERLIDELWGERPPATAAKSVHVYVSQLRKELGPVAGNGSDVLLTRGNGYVARVGPRDLDTLRFEALLADGRRALAGGDPARASIKLAQAMGVWRGPPLADFAYEPFAQPEIARLEELRLVGLEARIEADLALGRHAEVVGELEGLVAAHPLRERLRGQLMLGLYRCGRQAEALQAYRDGRSLLVSELGLEPGPELRALEAGILAQSPELAAPEVAAAPRRVAPPLDGAPPDAVPPAVPDVHEPAPRRRRRLSSAWMIAAAGAVLLAAAALAAFAEHRGGKAPAARPALDLAANSIAAVDPATGAPRLALPLPGRPADLSAAGDTVWVVTVDSAALTAIDTRTRSIARTVPLRGTPSAVAAGAGAVWVADGRRGVLARVEPGYEQVTARIRFRDTRLAGAGNAAVAVGGGAVWVVDGTSRLARVDPVTGRAEGIEAGRPLRDVAVGAGAVWAVSTKVPSLLRFDPATGAVTDRLPIVARGGQDAPFPVGLAVTSDAVWILSTNTATVTRVDPRTTGIVATIPVGVDRVPNEIAAAGTTAWVANDDGTLSRLGADAPRSLWVGESLRSVAITRSRVWVTTTALDQRLPGGAG
jgi:DNA-binding SARP family transcriptional activator